MRERFPGAIVLSDAVALGSVAEGFDAAIVDGLLEDESWDRWLLQRVHRVLRLGAPIVVVVPPLTSLASAIDLRFLLYASNRLLARAVQRLWPGFELPGPVRRRYHLPWLIRKMESLGYTAVQPGAGWPQASRSPLLPWLAQRSSVVACKASSVAGRQGRSWPDAQAHLQWYAKHYAPIPASRDAWLSVFPELRRVTPCELDPSEWRGARVLVLSPHPDDELIGCGGTLCRLGSAGAKLTILQATDGCRLQSLRELARSRRKSVRQEEAAHVASKLGAELVVWREEDTRLRCSAALMAKLAHLMRDVRPTHVFAPFLGDRHADHRALSDILAGALPMAGVEPQILQYEVWSLSPANLYCDITACVETLEDLMLLYEYAMRVDDFVHFCQNRNLARALELTKRHAYVEAFLATTSAEYQALAARSPSMA
ncbi:MAG TPA: PIG-L family deacetylase [Burkholderiales bacterium]|jgi:LmbE family N-acetylglucosaminyl deacetylase|nr:PIG-L family deacetylase [Burkholderiales bacterium]